VSSDDDGDDDSPRNQQRRRLIQENAVEKNPAFVTFQLHPIDQEKILGHGDSSNNESEAADDENESGKESDNYDDRDKVDAPDPYVQEDEIQERRDFLNNFFVPMTEDGNAAVTTSSVISEKKQLKSVLQLEIDSRIEGIRKMDVANSRGNKQQVTWPNLMKHINSALNLTEVNSTVMIQLFKNSGLIEPHVIRQLADTGKGLMRLPDKQMAEARLLYQ
jgi:hypothetical protein